MDAALQTMLYRTMMARRPSLVLRLSLGLLLVYAGFLAWYVGERYLSAAQHRLLSDMLVLWASCFLAMCRIPDQLFSNRHIAVLLTLPIQADTLVYTVLQRLRRVQLLLLLAAKWPFLLWHPDERLQTLLSLIACYSLLALIDQLLFFSALALSNCLPTRVLGYGWVLFQYGSFLLLAFGGGKMLLFLLLHPDLTIAAPLFFSPTCWLLVLLGLSTGCRPILRCSARRWYIAGYINSQRFHTSHHPRTLHFLLKRTPYVLLESTRILRSKELLFYATIKNIFTVCLLFWLFQQRSLSFVRDAQADVPLLFLMGSCCAINTISSTAYSSDENRNAYSFLPLAPQRLLWTKASQGFFWNLPLVVLFWTIAIITNAPSPVSAFWLLLYGISANACCAWLGVVLDHAMPRTPASIHELLHGNLSKVIVLFSWLAFTLGLLHLLEQTSLSFPPLILAAVVQAALALCLYGGLGLKGGFFYD